MLLQNVINKENKKTIEYAKINKNDTIEKIIIRSSEKIVLYFHIIYSNCCNFSCINIYEEISNKNIKINKRNKSIYFYINMHEYEQENYIKSYYKDLIIKFNEQGWNRIIKFIKNTK